MNNTAQSEPKKSFNFDLSSPILHLHEQKDPLNDGLIRLKGVNKVFSNASDSWVLKDINLEIKKSTFSVVFGPSGCGKSTMLNMILGLEKATTGEISVFGHKISQMTPDEISEYRKRNVGIIYQQPNWIKALDVISNVAFPLLLNGTKRSVALAEAGEMLRKVGMDKWSDYVPTELSAGQQQKVALARALITNPQIIFADEPTGNLDYKSGLELIDIFDRLVKEGTTIIMVTHNLENFGNASNVIQMLDGRIVKVMNTVDDPDAMKKLLIETPIELIDEKKQIAPVEQVVKINRREKFGYIMKGFWRSASSVMIYFAMIPLHLIYITYYNFANLKWTPQIFSKFAAVLNRTYENSITFFEGKRKTIRYIDIIDLSLKNLFYKKVRALVTIGGISLGIGFIVLLVSVGYGLESLVINRVAKLNELRQADVAPAVSSSIKIDDKALAQLKSIKNVKKVLPIVNAAASIEYNSSSRDIVIYGVQTDYLKETNLNLLAGKLFENNDLKPEELAKPKVVEEVAETTETTPEVVTTTDENQLTVVELPISDKRELVANSKFIELLGLTNNDAVGKKVNLTYVITGDLLEQGESLSSHPVEYTIIGIIGNEDSPIAYVPIKDIKELGVMRYSQAKVVTTSEEALPELRQSIHALGYTTSSVVDTVDQIAKVFSTVRVAFAVAGLVALVVATLGMFNTLTISLLERTREVGLMKALGMKSDEVSELLLSESMTIAVIGGIGGLVIGFIAGKLISVGLSVLAFSANQGFLDISSVPFSLVAGILGISIMVGWITGYFPTRRATNISALDALRYE